MNSETIIKVLINSLPIIKVDKLPLGFDVTLEKILSDNHFLDRERLNILLSYWHIPPMTSNFYSHYFGGELIDTVDKFQSGINRFIKDSLWHFGDLQRAYIELNEEESDVDKIFRTHFFDVNDFKQRLPWKLIKGIPPEDRGLLGYVSGEKPFRQKVILSEAEEIIKELEDNVNEYSELTTTVIADRILGKLKYKLPNLKAAVQEIKEITSLGEMDLFSKTQLEKNKESIRQARHEIERTIEKVNEVKVKGKENQEQYLRNIESIDIYVATSMRNDKEYLEMTEFISKTFQNAKLTPLNLRYFDPTLCYCESRLDKGIIECLLVRTSKLTIYCAQEDDTFGKDSELSSTLVQGKPVIVYVPLGTEKLDRRAKIFKEFHPLGLQVGIYDGVARGVIVVRTAEECVEVLYRILTNSLEVDIKFEEHGIVLREKLTQSVVRVMSGWGTLSSAFWDNFHKSQDPKTGSCV